jgi:hypothetical protein
LATGEILEINQDVFFYKSLTNLAVTIKSKKVTIKHNNSKNLVDNNYRIPNHSKE